MILIIHHQYHSSVVKFIPVLFNNFSNSDVLMSYNLIIFTKLANFIKII